MCDNRLGQGCAPATSSPDEYVITVFSTMPVRSSLLMSDLSVRGIREPAFVVNIGKGERP